MVKTKTILRSMAILLVIVFLLSISKITRLITDYMWFNALGFSQIFLISLKSKIILFFIGLITFFIFLAANLLVSSKKSKIVPFKIKLAVAFIISSIAGIIMSSQWFLILQYLHQVPFNLQDPIFLKDVSFYVFSLPFFLSVWGFSMACIVITTFLVTLDYLSSYFVDVFRQPQSDQPKIITKSTFGFKPRLKRGALVHIAVLLSFVFILLAVKHYLSRFSIMFSEKGIVVGAGYSDVVAFLPITKVLMVSAMIVSLVLYIWIFYISKKREPKNINVVLYTVAIYLVLSFIGPTMLPGFVQAFKVSPNEISLEKQYIRNNIEFTKIAYGLSDVVEKDFPVGMNLTADSLDSETLDNVRILDWRPLTQTYKQTQEIRLYYDLSQIDIDRYDIDGKYTQVMIAARELNQNQITENAKTWVNLNMVYTHGFGVVMSPVNSVTDQGLPNFFIKDIPPVYNFEDEKLRISKPQIYYGEKSSDFVLVNTDTEEFDFPKGNANEYTQYDGKGGVKLHSFFRRLLVAVRFGDIKILLSGDITSESKIMFIRNIQERISKITPFLMLDNDPYLVIHDGRLFWIQDAYTVSDKFPYSQKYGDINYIRNSVKIIVDAYDGSVAYYVIDKDDPFILTYGKIFPKEFNLFEGMPEELKKHIRYPEDIFKVQSGIYSIYHMNDTTVFYNKEDAWQIPFEIYGTSQKIEVEPYYIIMKLPGESKEEFVLISPFTPIKKDNMIAWLAARNDGANYGKLLLHKFPKDKLIYGPLQIEARFDQDSEISQQLTLWSQQGSRVTRGNLLVIPIKNDILYIEPLYLQAEKGQLPELKRILVSDGNRVVMEEDLATALEVLFGKTKKIRKVVAEETKSDEELIREAQIYYDSILDSMKEQNWVSFGENFDKLGNVLKILNG